MERLAGERVGDLAQLVRCRPSGGAVADGDRNLDLGIEERCPSEPAVGRALLRRDIERMIDARR